MQMKLEDTALQSQRHLLPKREQEAKLVNKIFVGSTQSTAEQSTVGLTGNALAEISLLHTHRGQSSSLCG